MADLPLHIHREVIHHGAEIALLRDLYLRRDPPGLSSLTHDTDAEKTPVGQGGCRPQAAPPRVAT